MALIHPQLSEFAAAQLWLIPFTARYLDYDELKTIVLSYLQSPDQLSQKKRFVIMIDTVTI